MHGDMREFARRQERFRGLIIGLALGDAQVGPHGGLVAGPRPTSRCGSCMR